MPRFWLEPFVRQRFLILVAIGHRLWELLFACTSALRIPVCMCFVFARSQGSFS